MAEIGKTYQNGEAIVREGEVGDCMYVIPSGQVEVVGSRGTHEVRLGVLGETDFFGEMAIFEREKRMATVRALGEVRVLTVDRKSLLRRISEDPSMAFPLLEKMSHRVRRLDHLSARISAGDRRNRETRPETWERDQSGEAR